MSSKNSLALPLRRLLATAAKALPRETGETERAQCSVERGRTDRPGCVVILADTSGSMADLAGSRTKSELLIQTLNSVWGLPGDTKMAMEHRKRLFAFDSAVREVFSPASLPPPSGGTALHLSLEFLSNLSEEQTSRVIVISDGQPDDAPAALAAAEKLRCRIDVIYCGPDSDSVAIDFMRRLARVGCGECVVEDVARAAGGLRLTAAVKRLALPVPGVQS